MFYTGCLLSEIVSLTPPQLFEFHIVGVSFPHHDYVMMIQR